MVATIKIGEGNHGPLRPLESDKVCACGHFRREHTLDSRVSRCTHFAYSPRDAAGGMHVDHCGCMKFVPAAEAAP
jgi:hypothetical protein